jgi:hypothetical protein
MVIVETLNVGNVTQFILKECSRLSDTVCVFATARHEPKICSVIVIFLFNMCFSFLYSYCNRCKVLFSNVYGKTRLVLLLISLIMI